MRVLSLVIRCCFVGVFGKRNAISSALKRNLVNADSRIIACSIEATELGIFFQSGTQGKTINYRSPQRQHGLYRTVELKFGAAKDDRLAGVYFDDFEDKCSFVGEVCDTSQKNHDGPMWQLWCWNSTCVCAQVIDRLVLILDLQGLDDDDARIIAENIHKFRHLRAMNLVSALHKIL
jgi:hypothetical protein